MKEKIRNVKSKINRFVNKAEDIVCRPFDITFALRRKKDPENAVVTVNVKGEVSKKALLFLSIVGALTTAAVIYKTVKFIKDLF